MNLVTKVCLLWLLIVGSMMYVMIANVVWKNDFPWFCSDNYNSPDDFEGFDNETGTENGCKIIPNYVHFIRFGLSTFSFVEAVCVLSVLKNQKPDLIFFHTDLRKFEGKYWNYLLAQKGFKKALRIEHIELEAGIFGQPFLLDYFKFHASDIARIRILMKYGGIYLDNDCFVVKNLDEFRKFEFTIGWISNEIANQAIIAHKNARFLPKWLYSYKNAYNQSSWYYNAGKRPVEKILSKKPNLVHRMKHDFAEYKGILNFLYDARRKEWKDHYVIHLLSRHTYFLRKNTSILANYPMEFDEFNIKQFPITFQDMVASVYPLK